MARQDHGEKKINSSLAGGVVGEKKFKNFPRRDKLARSYSKFFLAGVSLIWSKCTNLLFSSSDPNAVFKYKRDSRQRS